MAETRLSGRREATLALVVLAVAILTRTLWYAGETPRFWFSETATLHSAAALAQGTVWRDWKTTLGRTQVNWTHESALMMPVAVAMQAVLGPSLHLQLLVGAVWGVLAVVLAWLLGRQSRSPEFGLAFGALVAASPLQIAWSRLGGLHIGGGAHVLLALWLGYLAGKRGSILLAVLAGVSAWASVYHYYSARLALPLAFVGLVAGAYAARQHRGRTVALVATAALSLVTAFFVLSADAAWSTFWPDYLGYVGNRGTPDVLGLGHEMVQALRSELPHALWLYFWRDRTLTDPVSGLALLRPAVGGLCLLPVAALGIVGVVVALRNLRRDGVWLTLVALGLLVPCFSKSTARRFLVFDIGWCALAAVGLVAVLDAARVRTPGRRAVLTTAVGVAFAGYGFALLLALDARILPHYPSVIPFGESGFSDGMTCRGCSRRASRWQSEIASGSFVVLFDGDPYRENPTSPGGLPVYGKIAALAAGRPENFVEYYTLVANLDWQPPRPGPIHDPGIDEVTYLMGLLDRAAPESIRWHFAQPSEWERWLADRLAAAGGELRVLDDPRLALAELREPDPAIEVTTPWERRSDALAVLGRVARRRGVLGCLHVEKVAAIETDAVPLVIRAVSGGELAIGTWSGVTYRNHRVMLANPVALATGSDVTSPKLHILTRDALQAVWDPTAHEPSVTPPEATPSLTPPIGLGCAARVDGAWWVVDPVHGRVVVPDGAAWRPPEGHWTGIASDGAGRLVLGSADQWLHVFDVATHREIVRFPAPVPPSVRVSFGECTPIVTGDGWIATFDHLRSRLAVYDQQGLPLQVVRLDELLDLPTRDVSALEATGSDLAIATGASHTVWTVRLRTTECSAAARTATE